MRKGTIWGEFYFGKMGIREWWRVCILVKIKIVCNT